MIAQYIIDWGYVRQKIQNAQTDSDYDLIRQNLKRIRKAIESNGVLFCDRKGSTLRELIVALKELRQDGDQVIPVWQKLFDELDSCRKLYEKKRILLNICEESSDSLVKARDAFMAKANLDSYDLPYVYISSNKQAGAFSLSLEEYEDSDVEKKRERWSRLSFTKDDEAEADNYWAALSVGASAFGDVQLFDPFCLSIVFRHDPKANLGNWTASIEKIASFFVRNSAVKSITFVGELDDVVNRQIHLDELRNIFTKTMAKRHQHRDEGITCAICTKKIGSQWHNRWLEIGVAQCACDDGFELYERESESKPIHIRKTFGVGVMGCDREPERKEAKELPCHSYRDLCQACGNGTRIIGFRLDKIKPQSQNLLVEFVIDLPAM